MENLPERISEWLHNRGLSDFYIEEAKLGWNGTHIVIPIFDKNKKFLFNKYRRDPLATEGAKYMYDAGATSALYQTHLLPFSKEVIICEGEFDALVLRANGFTAVTSTGGASTFDEEWVNYFLDKKVFICFDRDEAGYKGAFNVQAMIPWASIVWLPEEVGDHGDITDYFTRLRKSGNDFIKLIATAKTYNVPIPLKENPEKKKELDAIIRNYKTIAEDLLKERQELRARYKSDKHLEILSNYLLGGIQRYERVRKYMGRKLDPGNVDRLRAAKQVPIDKFIEFNRARMANCIWHNETTPSMHYYPSQGRVKCFGCDKMGDVIDVVQQLKKVELKEAIEYILSS